MKTNDNSNKKDPFAGCVITEMVRRGERRHYSYPQNRLPEVTVKSASAWSPFAEAAQKAARAGKK
ncbi:MAG: hypothetical protein HAW59_00865 [Betaproteobacteria bacterium]|nr:hypothetical protein [Betaproteobacteria bacterium]